MTRRAVIIGLVLALLMGVGGQHIMKHVPGGNLVRGHLPFSVFGALIFVVVIFNPLLTGLRRRWRLQPREIAVMLALVLVACGIADAGLMRFFPAALVYPIHRNRVEKGWQDAELISTRPGSTNSPKTPPWLLAGEGKDTVDVVDNYMREMGDSTKQRLADRWINVNEVPWHAWWRPLAVWGGIIVFSLVGVVCLSVVVHRQWARHEQLRYPLADLALSLLKQDEQGRTSILRNRMFWVGLAVIFSMRAFNMLNDWFPDLTVRIPFTFDFTPLAKAFPKIMSAPLSGFILRPRVYPACVGLAFLLATDISFSLGISNLLTVLILAALIPFGLQLSGGYVQGGVLEWQNFGSYVAFACILAYIGRRYYWTTLKEAVTFRPQTESEMSAVWACRGLIVCMTAVTAILVAVGLDWPLAVLGVLLTMLMFLICTRLNAECGTFFYKPTWMMPGVLVGLFGLTTLGPTMIIILGMTMYILTGDPFEAMMPFVSNGLKVTSDTGLKVGRTALLLGFGLLVMLAIALPFSIWADYNHRGAARGGWYSTRTFKVATDAALAAKELGKAEEVESYSTWDRIRHMRPDRRFWIAGGIGFGLVLLCSFLRLRHPRWPLHPVAFIGIGAWTIGKYSTSFFVGWIIKVCVVRWGGGRAYNTVRPMMIGIVVGDLFSAFLGMVINWIYYGATGTAGKYGGLW
jgi:hypothetical protein